MIEIEVLSINSAFPPPPDKDFHDFRNFLLSGGFFCQYFMDESAPSPIFKNNVVRVPGMYHMNQLYIEV